MFINDLTFGKHKEEISQYGQTLINAFGAKYAIKLVK